MAGGGDQEDQHELLMAQILQPIHPPNPSSPEGRKWLCVNTICIFGLLYEELLQVIVGIKVTKGTKKQNTTVMDVAAAAAAGLQMSDSVDVTSAASRQTSCVHSFPSFCSTVSPSCFRPSRRVCCLAASGRPQELAARCFDSIFIIIVPPAVRANLLIRSRHPIAAPQPAGVDKRLCHSVM